MALLRRFNDYRKGPKSATVVIGLLIVCGIVALAVRTSSSSSFAASTPSVPPSPAVDVSVPSFPGVPTETFSATQGPPQTKQVEPNPDAPVSSDDPPIPAKPRPTPPDDGIDSFEDCAAAGHPIAESFPEQCFTPDGRSFARQL
ncbi:MAG: hypothetical protein ACT4OM_07075 [Actinomycetota bacterium]